MLDKHSIYSRLILCLLLSVVLHGGAVYLGWLEAPAHLSIQSPVEVSFLPVVEVSQPTAEKVIEKKPEPKKQESSKPQEEIVPHPKPKPEVERKKKEIVAESPAVETKVVEFVEEQVVADKPAPEAQIADESSAVEPEAVVESVKDAQSSEIVSGTVIVDAVPRYSSNPLPEYPYLARQRHWEGVVWLLVDVSADGSVDDLVVEQSSGYKILDRAATRTVTRWRFEPATRAGLPVSSKARIPVRFRLEGS
jgi:protein TonB